MGHLTKVTNKELTNASDILKLQYARNVALLEVELNKGLPKAEDEKLEQLLNYSSSTVNRRNFLLHCIVAKIDNAYITVADTRKLVVVSRAGMDVMINECEEAGWISVKRNKQGHRRLQGTDLAVRSMLHYSDHLAKLVQKYDTNTLVYSIGHLEQAKFLLDTK
jgi:hypothetical protein